MNANLLVTPTKPIRSRSNTATSLHASPALLRIASSSSTSTVKLSSDFAGQVADDASKNTPGGGSSPDDGPTQGQVPYPMSSRPPSILSRRSTASAATGTSRMDVLSTEQAGRSPSSSGRSSPRNEDPFPISPGNVAAEGLKNLMIRERSRMDVRPKGPGSADKGKGRAGEQVQSYTTDADLLMIIVLLRRSVS